MSNTNTKPSITIVGCGPSGSLLASLLGQRGYKVSVFEKRPDMRLHDISAGRSINLALANRGIKPLEAAGVMDEVEPTLITMEGRMIHETDGNLQLQKYGQQAHEVIYSVSRGDLNKILMNSAEKNQQVNLSFDIDITNIDLDSKAFSYLENGETKQHQFEILIGADGAGSIVRAAIEKMNGEDASIYSVEQLGHSYKELHIPAIQLADNETEFAMESQALHIWPRSEFMLIALPNEDKSFTVTLFLSNEGDNSFKSLQNNQQLNDFFEREFADAKALIPDLDKDFFDNPTGHLGTVRCDQWNHQDSVLLIGDAAHAVVPFHGQGMNCAFEDCLELVEQLEKNNDDWSLTINQFFSIRKPNSDAIADMAIANYVEMRASVRDKKFQLRKELSWKLEDAFPEHFIPRYSMVMFHHLPYSDAFKRGAIQQDILETLTEDTSHISSVDMKLAAKLVLQKLSKFTQ